MVEYEAILDLYTTREDGLPLNAAFRLESLSAIELRATIATAAIMLAIDALDESAARVELTGLQAKIDATQEPKARWISDKDLLLNKISTAEAWYRERVSIVLTYKSQKNVVFTGAMTDIVTNMIALVTPIAVKPSIDVAKIIQDYPIPAPAPAPAPIEAAPVGEKIVVWQDIPEEPPITITELPDPVFPTETNEEMIQREVKAGMSLADARKKARLKGKP